METEPVEPGEDGACVFDYVKALEGRTPGPALVSALMGTPMVVTVHRGEVAIGTVSVDMLAFTTGVESIGGSYALTKIPFEGDLPKPEPEPPADGDEAAEAEPEAGGEGAPEGGEEEDTRPKNPLLDGASVELSVTPTFPPDPDEGSTRQSLVSEHDAIHGGILTLTAVAIAPLPKTLIDVQAANDDHWEFAVAMPLEGLAPATIRGGATVVEKDDDGEIVSSRVEFAPETSTARVWMPAATFAAFRDSIRGKGPAKATMGCAGCPSRTRTTPSPSPTGQSQTPPSTACSTREPRRAPRRRRFARRLSVSTRRRASRSCARRRTPAGTPRDPPRKPRPRVLCTGRRRQPCAGSPSK